MIKVVAWFVWPSSCTSLSRFVLKKKINVHLCILEWFKAIRSGVINALSLIISGIRCGLEETYMGTGTLQ